MDMMMMALKSLAVFQSFMLQGKPDPDNIIESKKLIRELFEKLSLFSENPSESFFDANISQVISDHFTFKRSEQLSLLSLQSPTWRLFHALFDYLEARHLQMAVPEPESAFA